LKQSERICARLSQAPERGNSHHPLSYPMVAQRRCRCDADVHDTTAKTCEEYHTSSSSHSYYQLNSTQLNFNFI